MATTTLHVAEAPTKPALHEDLKRLSDEASRMEEALRGISGALKMICYHGMLDSLPADTADRANHEAATSMLRLLENHATGIVDADRDWDISCELVMLADKAKAGALIRYGKLVPEPL